MAGKKKSLRLDDIEKACEQFTVGKAGKFKNQPNGTRIPIFNGNSSVFLMLSDGRDDALVAKFGISLNKKDNPNTPDKWGLALSIPKDSKQFTALNALQKQLLAICMRPENEAWFITWPANKRKDRDREMNPILREPKLDENGAPLYGTDYMFKANVNLEKVVVYVECGVSDAGKPKYRKGTWQDVTPFSECIASVSLTNLYVVGKAWGATFYADTIMVKPSENSGNGVESMQVDFEFEVEEQTPTLGAALAADTTYPVPNLQEPLSLEDVF